MDRHSAVLFTGAALALILSACNLTAEAEPTPLTPGGAAPQETQALAEDLRDLGAEVAFGERIRQDFFEPEGQVLLVDGEAVQVFEWPSEELAAEAVATISADGSSVGTTMITWVDTPHFYARGALVVLYVGSNGAVEDLLAGALGDPVAEGM